MSREDCCVRIRLNSLPINVRIGKSKFPYVHWACLSKSVLSQSNHMAVKWVFSASFIIIKQTLSKTHCPCHFTSTLLVTVSAIWETIKCVSAVLPFPFLQKTCDSRIRCRSLLHCIEQVFCSTYNHGHSTGLHTFTVTASDSLILWRPRECRTVECPSW